MSKKKKQGKPKKVTGSKGSVSFDVRIRIVREVLRGANQVDVALAFGVSVGGVQKYMALYRHGDTRRCDTSRDAQPRRAHSVAR